MKLSVHRLGRGAFTLVELLVVIGIIAVLIGILLPALNNARVAANITKCTAVAKQVAAAAQLHVANHKGYYPLAGYFGNEVTTGEPSNFNDSAKQKYSYYYFSGTTGTNNNKFQIASWHAALAQYMTKRRILDSQNNDDFVVDEAGDGDYLRFFICPAHVGRSDEVAATDSDEPWVWGYNNGGSVYGFTAKSSYLVNEAVFGYDSARKQLKGQANKVKDPARTMMMMDGLAYRHYSVDVKWGTMINATYIGRVVNGKPVTSFSLADAFSATTPLVRSKEAFDKARHKGKVDILFMDGHAETRRIEPKDLGDVYLQAPGTNP